MQLVIRNLLLIIIPALFMMSSHSALESKNVLGTALEPCCFEPMTGYFRDGHCLTDQNDYGTHTVCAVMTQDFLDYTKAQGNDLCTARPEYRFPGLKAGDKWCLCAVRWLEAYHAGLAPKVVLESTHEKTLSIVKMEFLKKYAVTPSDQR